MFGDRLWVVPAPFGPTNPLTRPAPSLSERVAAAVALAAGAPVLVLAAAAIKLDDRGPVVFRQGRLGVGRRRFVVWKLRTMADGRVTRVGALLRRTKLDELPQLWNVVRGEMRVVGPRPITEADATRLGWDDASADARWSVPPGITGPTQLSVICDAERALARDTRFATEATARDEAEIVALSLVGAIAGRKRIARRVERWT